MLIRYTGNSQTRIVGKYTWNWGRQAAQVEADDVGDLITHDGFEIDTADPLLQLVGRDMANAMAVEGITCPAELAQVKEIKALAVSLGVTQKQCRFWVKSAGDVDDLALDVVQEKSTPPESG